ncbi:MAG TPA: carboxylesterase family protein [Acetobacteraceae bacterium]|nr:carboxylesterase family protein [Acetobacteraceae bacterium]
MAKHWIFWTAPAPRWAAAIALGASCLAGLSAPSLAESAHTTAPTLVPTEFGWVQGQTDGRVNVWLGIHYAGTTAGEYRWTPPRPPEPYGTEESPFAATEFATPCPQNISPFGNSTPFPVTANSVPGSADSEDCLALNIWAPAEARGALPVFVWIHGGSNVYGEGSSYDPRPLVTQGHIIVVAINYRLGALGWLAHPLLDGDTPNSSGNYGLMDQQFAMRWVQDNIASFGGDPSRVTIGGESAGGLDTCSHLASPTAAGLFRGGIVESGCTIGQTPQATYEAATGSAFVSKLNCTTLDCLRSSPIGQILAAEAAEGWGPVAGPNVPTLPELPQSAFASGAFNRVPVLQGTNLDEGRLFTPLSFGVVTAQSPAPSGQTTYSDALAALLPRATPDQLSEVASRYAPGAYEADGAAAAPGEAISAVITDSLFACTALRAENALSQYVPTYVYEFRDRTAPELFIPPTVFPYGAAHGSELQYLFNPDLFFPNTTYPFNPFPLNAQQRQLSREMIRYWSNFVSTLDPNLSGANAPWRVVSQGRGDWAPFSSQLANVEALVEPGPFQATDFAAEHQCSFWDQIGLVSGL